jgi:branched-subunit amino acid transport protein
MVIIFIIYALIISYAMRSQIKNTWLYFLSSFGVTAITSIVLAVLIGHPVQYITIPNLVILAFVTTSIVYFYSKYKK